MKTIATLLLLPVLASAGIVHVSDIDTDFGDDKGMSMRMTMYVDGDNMRVEPRRSPKDKSEGMAAMTDGTVVISQKDTTYACMPPSMGQKMCVKSPAFSPMSLSTKEGQRRTLVRFEYKRKGKSKKIAGYGCDEYDVTTEHRLEEGKQSVQEVVASVICLGKVPGMEGMLTAMGDREIKGMKLSPKLKGKYMEFKKLGFLLEADSRTEIRGLGGKPQKVRSYLKTVSVEQKPLAPSVFQIPKGYQVMDMAAQQKALTSKIGGGEMPEGFDPSKLPPEVQEMIKKQMKAAQPK